MTSQTFSVGRVAWWLLVLVSFALLLFLIGSEALRFSTPISLHRLQIMQEIPLPDALPDAHRTSQNPFAPGQAQRFDHFDFQSLDPDTHLLFIVHTGPNPDKQATIYPSLSSMCNKTRLLDWSLFPRVQVSWLFRILAKSLLVTPVTVSFTLLMSIVHSR
jgi:hypothetical protein